MFDFFYNLDVTVLLFVNRSLSYPWLDQLTPILTDLHFATLFKAICVSFLLVLFLKKYKRIGISYFLFLILSVSISDFIGGQIKKIVERPRPFQIEELNVIQKSPARADRSFYSNHSSNMFTFASYMTAFFPAGKIIMFSAAGFIAFTRVHVGVHYPSDVIFGALMGLLVGYLMSYFIKRMTNQLNRSKNE
jgi:undecaprenyl-diphosphatase